MRQVPAIRSVVLGAVATAIPLWIFLWFCDSFNDKPYGWHATVLSYGAIAVYAFASAIVALVLSQFTAWADGSKGVYWPFVGLTGIVFFFAYWCCGPNWTFEYRDLNGNVADPPRDSRR